MDHFQPGVPDVVWIPLVAQRRWVILTTDVRLRYNLVERDAIMGSNAAVLILVSSHAHPELASYFLACRDLIVDFLQNHDPPFIARLYRDRIEMWLNRDNWTT